jgi:hypothetical protein
MIPRTLYIDPGTAWTAWVIAERADPMQADALPLRVVDHDKIETGALVPLPPHRVTVRTKADGSEVTQDKERIVSRADRVRVGATLEVIARRHGVTRVVIERVGHTFLRGGSKGGDMKQAESAKQTALVEEKIVDFMEAAGLPVVPVTRATWANRLRMYLGEKVVGAPAMSRAELLPVLMWGYAGAWPRAAEEHRRDCGGMSLWDALPPLETRRAARAATAPRGPRKPRQKRTAPRGDRVRGKMGPLDLAKYRATDRARYERTKGAARAAAREAAGCNCREPGQPRRGRHKKTCAMHRPKVTAKAADKVAARVRYLDGAG